MTIQLRANDLRAACQTGEFAPLLNLAVDVNSYDDRGGFLLMRFVDRESFTDRHLETLPHLIRDLNADVRLAHRKTGVTVLHMAAKRGHIAAVEILLEKGADIEAKSTAGVTPLSFCTSFAGNSEVIEYLLSKRSLIDSTNKSGQTALHIAADRGQVENARVLRSK